MRDVLRFMLATMSDSLNFEYWCKLNEYIARNEALEWGKLRTGSVGISGTDYLPPVPAEDQTRAELNAILSADTTATTKALEAFVWGTRGQFFWDGNKRTSMTLANKILISAGAGFLTITDRHMEQFNTLLVDYYNTGKSEMTVKNALAVLERQGLISRKRQGAGLPSKIYVQVQTENCPTGWTSFKPQTDKKLSTSNKQRKMNEKPIRNYDYEEGDSL
jgi:hypothetical protein